MKRMLFVLASLSVCLISCEESTDTPDASGSDAPEILGPGGIKLVKEIEIRDVDDYGLYSFSYDSEGRLKEWRSGDYEVRYEYLDDMVLVKEVRDGKEDDSPEIAYLNNGFYITKIVSGNITKTLTYDDNSCLSVFNSVNSNIGYVSTTTYEWKDSNVTNISYSGGFQGEDQSECSEVRTYHDIEDKCNIDFLNLIERGILDEYCALDKGLFKGITSRNLLKRIEYDNYKYPIMSFSYKYDSEGYPVTVSIIEIETTLTIRYY